MSQATTKLLLECIPVIEHMSKMAQETILKFDVNSYFKEWYNVSYGDLKARTNEYYMKTVTTPKDFADFCKNKYEIMREMS